MFCNCGSGSGIVAEGVERKSARVGVGLLLKVVKVLK